MRKVGFFLLTLVLVLGTMGVAYAKWSDTVTINGTVNTGYVQIGIVDKGVLDQGADPQCTVPTGVFSNTEGKNVASTTSDNGATKCLIGTEQYYASVTESFSHVYPGYMSGFTIWLGNCGTVPIKIESVVAQYVSSIVPPATGLPAPCTAMADLISWMGFSWVITPEVGANITGSGNIYDFQAALDHLQIGAGLHIVVALDVCFNELNAAGATLPQNTCAAYNITVTGSQWNEVT